jgi:hypothetical protein
MEGLDLLWFYTIQKDNFTLKMGELHSFETLFTRVTPQATLVFSSAFISPRALDSFKTWRSLLLCPRLLNIPFTV